MEQGSIPIAALAKEFEEKLSISERKSTLGRYEFLATLIKPGDTLLDIGINSGSQLKLLAQRARMVIGVETSYLEARLGAFNTSHLNNTSVAQVNGEQLAFPDECFDVVSSFECIEHVNNPKKMLAEIRRVLKPNGFAVISTPNSDISGSRFLSTSHLREWPLTEFQQLLGEYFQQIDWYGQRITTGKSSQGLYTQIRSSFVYEVYTRMPRKAKSLASNAFQNATLGNSWTVKPLNLTTREKPLIAIAICKALYSLAQHHELSVHG